MTLLIKYVKLDKDATTPTKSNKTDAGWDLYASEDIVINGGEHKVVKTGVSFEIPTGFVGLVWPRSGLAVKSGVDVLAGVIDSGYRGEVMVCLLNTIVPLPLFETPQTVSLHIKKGERIAQILFQEAPEVALIESDNLSDSERGTDGFGSSGK